MRSATLVTRAIKPSDVDRFDREPQQAQSTPTHTRSAFSPENSRFEIVPGQTHPEGATVHSRGQMVSDQNFTLDLIRCGDQILELLRSRHMKDCTLFLRRKEDVIEHYIVDHCTESVTWVDEQRPDTLFGLPDHQERNILKEEYWAHMENYPGSRFVGSKSTQRLKDILSSLAIGIKLRLRYIWHG
ncbi:hypothetical protein FRC12_008461 [Ceratobasidium sp. 428]|nr:hypothetical protein FRC12_008461 [Ceratobasidium sp. 428]